MSRESKDLEYQKNFLEEIDYSDHEFFGRTTGVMHHYHGMKVVGRPRNQGGCSSCVACVVCDSIAAKLALLEPDVNKRKLKFLSVQQIVDCMPNFRNETDEYGCKHTNFQEVYRFVNDGHGLVEESTYRYAEQKQRCADPLAKDITEGKGKKCCNKDRNLPQSKALVPKNSIRIKVSGFYPHDVHNFKTTIDFIRKYGPIGATLMSTEEFREFSKKCVFDQIDAESENMDVGSSVGGKKSNKVQKGKQVLQDKNEEHAVLIIGYGKDKSTQRDFYIIKNSWGDESNVQKSKKVFGFHGYAKVSVRTFQKDGFSPKDIQVWNE